MKPIKSSIPYVTLFAFALIILSPIFSSGFLTKSDNPVHIAEITYLANNVLKQNHWINGWYPYEYAGFPVQMYYYQLGPLFVASLILSGINNLLAYKIALIISLFLPSAAIFYLLKKHFNRIIAYAVALAFLFQRDVGKLVLAGMWANLIAFAIFILIFAKITEYNFIITKKRALILGLLTALLIFAHPFFGVVILYTFLISFFISVKYIKLKRAFINYIIIALTALLISLFYIYPFVNTNDWLNPGSGWGLGSSIKETGITLIGIFFSLKPHTQAFNYLISMNAEFFRELAKSVWINLPMLIIDSFAVIGIIFYIKENDKKKSALFNFTILFTLVSLLIGTGFWFLFSFGKTTPFLNGILAYRFVYYARLGLFIFAAYALCNLTKHKENRLFRFISEKNKPIAICISFIVLIGFFYGIYYPPKDYTQTFDNAQISQETSELWAWLRENPPQDNSRILNQNFFDNVDEPLVAKDSILPAMAHYYTNLTFFGSWYTTVYPIEKKAQTENNQLFGKKISEITNQEIYENMKAYNIKYAIAISPELKSKFDNAELLRKKKEFEHYAVYELDNYAPAWIASEHPIQSQLIEFSDKKIVFKINNSYGSNEVNIKFSYHPYWHAFLNGKEVDLRTNQYYLMELEIPKGQHNITLEYNPKNPAAIIISLVSLIAAIILIRLKSRKKK